jgi:hypothetical protein
MVSTARQTWCQLGVHLMSTCAGTHHFHSPLILKGYTSTALIIQGVKL